VPIKRPISSFKRTLTNLAQTSHYQVIMDVPYPVRKYLLERGVDPFFITENVGLLCSSASLPGSSFATADIVGNFTGVVEKMAHTRQFTQIDLEFYVDSEYRTIKFLEHWMEFISSGSQVNPGKDGYFFRMKYPTEYKTNRTKIIKFDRDYKSEIEYTFFGLFPISLNNIGVSYDASNILKANVTFNFDRYVCGPILNVDFFRNINFNNSLRPGTVYRTGQSLGNESGVRPVLIEPGNVNPTVLR
jgi:hypothetical protein